MRATKEMTAHCDIIIQKLQDRAVVCPQHEQNNDINLSRTCINTLAIYVAHIVCICLHILTLANEAAARIAQGRSLANEGTRSFVVRRV